MTVFELCGEPYPGDFTVTCTLGKGHGRIKPPGAVEWFDHLSGVGGYWWNGAGTVLLSLTPDVSIARQDGQPGGENYVPRPDDTVPQLEPGTEPGTEVETWYGVFNDPAVLEPKFASGEIHEGLRGPLLETPVFESRNLGDVIRHAQLTHEDRQRDYQEQLDAANRRVIHRVVVVDGELRRPEPTVPAPVPVVVKTQVVTRTSWVVVDPSELRAAVGGPAVREVKL